jgi:hypothetical protein
MVVGSSFNWFESCQQMAATFQGGGGAKVQASPRRKPWIFEKDNPDAEHPQIC